ncbi:MAG: SH3 domain-containing protein [Chloroflexi bacterium]|nr:SH3 domain-containing protein [Chloroflexota bacterium]
MSRLCRCWLLMSCLLLLLVPTAAGLAQTELTAATTNNLKLRAGPGRGHPQLASLPAGVVVVLEARSDRADWALVHMADGSARGWVAAAYLRPGEGVRLGDLPVSAEQMAAPEYSLLDHLRSLPVVPGLTTTGRAVYERGLALGNDPHRFSKVGDCQNIPLMFLGPFDRGEYNLGPYSDLQATIDYFAGSFGRDSMSVRPGFNVYAVLDPNWAGDGCQAGESPQACEYRLWWPAFVIVSLEITSGITVERYESSLRTILRFWMDNGVVPILASKADNREGDWRFNAVIARLAGEFDIPLWNFLMAAQSLPGFGLEDGFHLTFAPNDFASADNLKAGWPWRNLTALQTLDAMRRAVN